MSEQKKTDGEVLDLIRGIISRMTEGAGPMYYTAMGDIFEVMENNKETRKSSEVQLLQNIQKALLVAKYGEGDWIANEQAIYTIEELMERSGYSMEQPEEDTPKHTCPLCEYEARAQQLMGCFTKVAGTLAEKADPRNSQKKG